LLRHTSARRWLTIVIVGVYGSWRAPPIADGVQ
jgi:hypothetical protein